MKHKKFLRLTGCLGVLCFLLSPAEGRQTGRKIQSFNEGWSFCKGDFPGAQNPGFDDSGWRLLDLPHDWSIEGPFSPENSSCTAYLPGGIGWYRKSFELPEDERGRKIAVHFAGIYNNSEVWINGKFLGRRPNGYISFQYDLTPHLEFGKKNVIAVRVDHSRSADSRWYTGSGIYREVTLVSTEPVHLKPWGVFCSTPEVSAEKAVLAAEITVVNETNRGIQAEVSGTLMNDGEVVGTVRQAVSCDSFGEKTIRQEFRLDRPRLWDPDHPVLYSLITEVTGSDVMDRTVTRVGFRDIKFDADRGFLLNGRTLKLKGVCLHHDAGALGAAVPAEEIARRLDLLKEMGCNAIRTSHNPFSPDFLDLCDAKGFLVIGEAFDEWELPKKKWLKGWNEGIPGKEGYAADFREWGRTDLRDFILRDRNHPSVIMWSIGNEIDYPNDPYTHPILNTEANPQTWAKYDDKRPPADRLGEIARELAAEIKKLDSTRPVTAGLASALVSNETGFVGALDVAGYNYQEFRYERDHRTYPRRPLYGSENGMAYEMWNAVVVNDYVMGQFLWTGFDYLGEAGVFPLRSNSAGVLDLAGNKKPEFYFRQSLWSDRPMIFVGAADSSLSAGQSGLWAHQRVEPVWNWDEGKIVNLVVFTNCEEAELFLNDRSLGGRRSADSPGRIVFRDVPFVKGTLRAVGKIGGREAASFVLKSTGVPVRIEARGDDGPWKADGRDLMRVFAVICDKDGQIVSSAENELTCEISGPARLLGMEDADPSNIEDYQDNRQRAGHGKLLIYLQSRDQSGKVKVKLTSPGLTEAVLEIPVVKDGPGDDSTRLME